MAIFKIMIEIQGQLFDLWNLKSLQKGEEYNDKRLKMDYVIWLNKDAMILEYKDIKFVYDTIVERDNDLLRIKQKLDEHETASVLWENDADAAKQPDEEKGEFMTDDEDADDLEIDETIAPNMKMLAEQIKKKKKK